ncbi:MAG: selenide,water dikinase [Granulosicoccus sp.]
MLLIRKWAMRALPGVRLTLVSSDSHSPYSGMLPGLIAGHYTSDEIHVDLRLLCSWAGVRFIEETMLDLDLVSRQIQFKNRPPMSFDVCSLDTGSTPDLSVKGASVASTPVKPVYNFHKRWQRILERVNASDAVSMSIGVVGSGAGGFELITAMRHALPNTLVKCHWFLRGKLPLRGRPSKVGELAKRSAETQGIEVIADVDVVEVAEGELRATDGRIFKLDEILWCTSAVGPDWARRSDMELDECGFVLTNQYLQSVSHPFVFATGDIGTQKNTPSAKAGVFAVRQAPVLYHNIRRYLLQQPLKFYKPQKDFLSLMATGGKRAIASRGPVAIEADWVWRWKDHIDRTFMRRFRELPAMKNGNSPVLPEALRDPQLGALTNNPMKCKGCGAKVSASVLNDVIQSLSVLQRTDVLSGVSQAVDTAVVTLPSYTLVQSVDQINAIVDDAYILGRIAALHALSDVVTVNAIPHSAQVLVCLPTATESISKRDLTQLMAGLVNALNEENCVLIGGHTTEGSELSIGVVINATQTANSSKKISADHNSMPVDNDVLILTQGLGTGTLFAGLMQQKGKGRNIHKALGPMQTSNRGAAELLRQHGALGITDVTGFGLLGHLDSLLQSFPSNIGVQITLESVPMLAGAKALSKQGVRSTLWPSNSRILDRVTVPESADKDHMSLLCDPQTSGGLLAIVPAEQQHRIIAALQGAGYSQASVIGSINLQGGYRVN